MTRDLDIQVAEQVMGCRIARHTSGHIHELGQGKERRYRDARIPCYSTDIAAAWEVVEEMSSKSWYLVLDQSPRNKKWYCRFRNNSDSTEEHGGATAPEAICMAALAAMEKS